MDEAKCRDIVEENLLDAAKDKRLGGSTSSVTLTLNIQSEL